MLPKAKLLNKVLPSKKQILRSNIWMMLTHQMLQLPQTHHCRAESQKALALADQVKEGEGGGAKSGVSESK